MISLVFLFLLAIILVKYKTINFKIFTNIKSVSVIVGALLAGPIGMQCNLYAVKYIGSGLTSSITAIYPAVSVILAVIFLKNKVLKNDFRDCAYYCWYFHSKL